jgi:hypothetical protein
MFRCSSCDYKSNRKYNLQKHIKNIHNRDATDEEIAKTQITSEITQITISDTQNTIPNTQITIPNTQITICFEKENLVCPKCQKNFKTSHGFKKHSDHCKGVSNILECHFCHHIFPSQQCKSQHIKRCKIKKLHEETQEQIKQIQSMLPAEYHNNNNVTTTNNNTNNTNNNQQIIYHIHNNNYRISSEEYNNRYDQNLDHEDIDNINDFGCEDISYIEPEQMKQIALNCDFKTLIREKHFNPEHPENHNIRNNCNKSYKVLKNSEWLVEPKDAVCSLIYNNSKAQVYDYAFQNLLHKMLDDDQSDQYLVQWQQYEKTCKKKLYNYIEIQIKELMKQRRLRLMADLENSAMKNIKNDSASNYLLHQPHDSLGVY